MLGYVYALVAVVSMAAGSYSFVTSSIEVRSLEKQLNTVADSLSEALLAVDTCKEGTKLYKVQPLVDYISNSKEEFRYEKTNTSKHSTIKYFRF